MGSEAGRDPGTPRPLASAYSNDMGAFHLALLHPQAVVIGRESNEFPVQNTLLEFRHSYRGHLGPTGLRWL